MNCAVLSAFMARSTLTSLFSLVWRTGGQVLRVFCWSVLMVVACTSPFGVVAGMPGSCRSLAMLSGICSAVLCLGPPALATLLLPQVVSHKPGTAHQLLRSFWVTVDDYMALWVCLQRPRLTRLGCCVRMC